MPSSRTLSLQGVAYILSLFLVMLLPWRGLTGILGGNITVARLVGLLAGIAWLGDTLKSGEIRRPDDFHLIFCLFIIWIGMSSMWSINESSTFLVTVTLSSSLLMSVVLWDLIREKRDLVLFIFAYVIGAYILILIESVGFLVIGSSRMGDVVTGPNYVVGYLVFAIPLAWYLFFSSSKSQVLIRYLGIAYIPIASISIIFTRSRQGLVVLVVALVMLALVNFNSRRSLQNFLALGAASLVPTLVVFNQYLIERFSGVIALLSGNVPDESLSTRLEIYSAGVDVFTSSPLIGTGAGTFPVAVEPILGQPSTGHSTYLIVATELGIVGIFFFTLLLGLLAKGLLNVSSDSVKMGGSILVIYIVIALVNNWFSGFVTWYMFTIVLLSTEFVD